MTTITRRAALASAASALVSAATARRATAQAAWPSRPLKLIVPVAPGGSQDVVARHWARAVSERIGHAITIENVPGGGSTIGYAAAARAAPDGHTLLAGADSLSIVGTLAPRLAFDPLGFAPVHRTVRVPQILVVRADHPARDLAAWLALPRAKGASVGTPGTGQLSHLLTAQLAAESGAELTHVSYRGGPLALNDLLAGHLDGVMINIGAVTEHVRAGRLRGLAVSPAARSTALPDVPTLTEAGFGALTAVGWHGIVAPHGTDPTILAKLNAASRDAVREPGLVERLAALGVEPTDEGPEALADAIREDAVRYGAIIRRFNIVAEG
ncbi:tripartite tricarboxylate transporter substrate binding protein [Elioraea sp.]|uniref:Bug family tripartite tricarboxylate transporter substrate binding protein n=1 Tax=Elioraea sp. TaxID=2185103 RepID=UPI0025BCD54D|nr:tripartite tricarboxylate transporter substrate binding protein [Elioraea sp.]